MKQKMILDGNFGGYIEGGDIATYYPELWAWVNKKYKPQRILDVGCAEGHAVHWWRENTEAIAEGIDGSPKAIDVAPENCFLHDLCDSAYFSKLPPDVVWCSEVAEHIEDKYVDKLLLTLTQAKKAVVMSHAWPGQGGYRHVNCRSTSYWVNQFRKYGWELDRAATVESIAAARRDADGKPVNHWERNGLVFVPGKRKERNLIMTAVSNYGWEQLRPFIVSLNQGGFSGDVVVLAHELKNKDTARKLERYGCWVIPASNRPPLLPHRFPHLGMSLPRMRTVYWRFPAYYSFLKQHGKDYGKVLLADARDAFFVDGPFSDIAQPDQLHVFAENVRVGDCPYNTKWLSRAYGEEMARKMAERPVYCAGILIGGVSPIMKLCMEIAKAIEQRQPNNAWKGLDQAVLNHSILLDNNSYTVHNNGEGMVWHVGYLPRDEHISIREGAAVIHQYDRNKELEAELLNRLKV